MVENKNILITGGAGAFGRKFIHSVKNLSPASVTVFSRDEMKHAALKREFPNESKSWLRYRIGDITRKDDLQKAIQGQDIIIHAAAMKHLPECEANVGASIRVNVEGTQNVADAFLLSSAENLIFLSTDKAPYSSTAYGAQKLMGEKIITETARLAQVGLPAKNGAKKRAFSLRYSNVMDSTGSVFHIFRDLLGQGKTATVNGTTMARGFVSQSQVIENLMLGLKTARGGEVFVLHPRVVRIADLAQTLQKLLNSGKVDIKEAPSFAGEKDSATLIMGEEFSMAKRLNGMESVETWAIDYLGQHSDSKTATFSEHAFTLEDCPTLSGSQLERFVGELLK